MAYTYEYPRPAVTVDVVVFCRFPDDWKVLLIRRGNPPFKDCWALPGGFVEMYEKLVESAERELMEETGLSGIHLKQFRAYGDPGRDPRGRTVGVIFYGFTKAENSAAKGGDDASEADWFSIEHFPTLAFDHDMILADLILKLKDEGAI
jgi:8-oxo-dGTP diphosphatase